MWENFLSLDINNIYLCIYLFTCLLTYLLRSIPKTGWTKWNFMLCFIVPWRYRIKNGRKTEKTTKTLECSTDSLHSGPFRCVQPQRFLNEGIVGHWLMEGTCMSFPQGLRSFSPVSVYPALGNIGHNTGTQCMLMAGTVNEWAIGWSGPIPTPFQELCRWSHLHCWSSLLTTLWLPARELR